METFGLQVLTTANSVPRFMQAEPFYKVYFCPDSMSVHWEPLWEGRFLEKWFCGLSSSVNERT